MGMIQTGERERGVDRLLDLDALNPAEREALALLAEGHTAKSIAELTGRSVAAINERLREARRKTGIGSSRELARLFAATQKNRDEKIDLAASVGSEATADPQAGATGRRRKGQIVMPLILIGGLAAALIAAQVKQSAAGATHVAPDAVILAQLVPFDVQAQTAELHALVRREARDEPWAGDTEAALRGRYSEIPHMNDTGEVRVLCATTLCEVVQSLPGLDQVNRSERGALDLALQSDPVRSDIGKLGLTEHGTRFSSNGSKPGQGLFITYWSRWRQPKPDALLDGKLGEDDRGERRFYKQVREETRDQAWAGRTERELMSVLQSLPGLSQGDHRLRVNCATTLCEISAMTSPHASPAQIDAFYHDLQTGAYNNAVEKIGLKAALVQLGSLPERNREIYVAYYRRNGG